MSKIQPEREDLQARLASLDYPAFLGSTDRWDPGESQERLVGYFFFLFLYFLFFEVDRTSGT